MPAREDCIVGDEYSRRLLGEVLRCYTEPRVILDRFELVSCRSSEGLELLLMEPTVAKALVKLHAFYTAGLHVASVRDSKILLHNALGLLLESVVARGYIRVTEHIVRLLTYGRLVEAKPRDVIEYKPSNCTRYLVLDERGRFVAWAVIEEHGDKLLIKPLIDVGWYLRSGV